MVIGREGLFPRFLLGMLLVTAACSERPAWKRAYDRCRERTEQEVRALKKQSAGGEAWEGPLNELAAGMAGGVGGALCESIRSICEPNPQGRACTEIVRAFDERSSK